FFFFQAEDGIRDFHVTGVQTCALPICEVHEELGVHLPCAPARVLRLAACSDTGQEFVWVYRCEHEGPFTLHPEEIDTGSWFSPRSEERRVGKECRSRRAACTDNTKQHA